MLHTMVRPSGEMLDTGVPVLRQKAGNGVSQTMPSGRVCVIVVLGEAPSLTLIDQV